MKTKKSNKDPVSYCAECLSLNIIKGDDDSLGCDYCNNCGSTNIVESDLESWEILYEAFYGEPVIEHKNNK
jgi:hypothetical protein